MSDLEHRKQLKESILGTLDQLKKDRSPTESVRWEACGMVRHRSTAFNLGSTKIPNIKLFDTTGMDAFKTLCNGISGYLISPSIAWFHFTTRGESFEPSDKIPGANKFLDDSVQIIRQVFSNTNFYPSTKLAVQDVVAQGTSAEFVVDELDNNRMNYDTIDPQEFYIAEDENRRVNTFFRLYSISANQAKKKWGDETPKKVQQLIEKGSGHQQCDFLHAIYPRDEAISKKGQPLFSTEKPFASIHYSYTDDEIFIESGYDEFPVAVHRWELNGTSPYGNSPVIELLPVLKEINELHKQYAVAVQKYVNPPIFAPEILKGRLNLNPGGVNYLNTAQMGKPELMQTSLDLNHLAGKIDSLERKIQREMHADLFNILMRQEQQRTATEVREIKGEGLVLLSSIIGNIQEEKIVPLVIRTFNILMRNGLLPEPSKELKKVSAGGRVKVELDGPLAQNMRAHHQTTGLNQALAGVGAVMQMNPDSAVNINFDEVIRLVATAAGAPATILRERAEVKKIKAEMVKAQQAQAEMEQAQVKADIAQKVQGSQPGGTTPQQMMTGMVGR